MTQKTPRQPIDMDAGTNAAMVAFQTWLNINRPMVAAMSEFNGRLIEQMARANSEWLAFLGRRLNEDIATSQRLMDCKTAQDVVAVYTDFMQRAQQQYQAEFQHFARLGQKMAADTANAMRAEVDTTNAELRH